MAEYSAHLLTRLQREVALARDPELAALLEDVRVYPGVTEPTSAAVDPATMLFLPMEFTGPDGEELSFFSTLATFGTALDITIAELSIEAFFPADERTASALRSR